jgi:hypothetical protein
VPTHPPSNPPLDLYVWQLAAGGVVARAKEYARDHDRSVEAHLSRTLGRDVAVTAVAHIEEGEPTHPVVIELEPVAAPPQTGSLFPSAPQPVGASHLKEGL